MNEFPGIINDLLATTLDRGASDLHIGAGHNPVIRLNGQLVTIDVGPVSETIIYEWLTHTMTPRALEDYERDGDADFSFGWRDGERFRGTLYRERGHMTLALRHLKARIPSLDEIGVPVVVREWANRETGLVLVTGPTGSGKSTTIASLVEQANQTRAAHIVTIEDPVEYVFTPVRSTIHQREIPSDSQSFARAVRAGLREDIDIMVVGELRDLATMSAAITVAETGHLVFATLHNSSAHQAVDRMIDAFDSSEQQLVRTRLASCLVGVVHQRLIKSERGGRVAAYEVLTGNYAVKNLIREGKTHQIPNVMTTSKADGMILLAEAVQKLVAAGAISPAEGARFTQQNSLNG